MFKKLVSKLKSKFIIYPKNLKDLSKILKHSANLGIIDMESLAMIEGVISVGELRVKDIMVPRSQMTVISQDSTKEEILPLVIETQHSRFPVMGDKPDEVVGVLLAKDLLTLATEDSSFNLQNLLRPALVIPETKRLDGLLQQFRVQRNHIAVVINEYGSLTGLVTIEDVLEEIVGEIDDEYDIGEKNYIKPSKDNSYIIKAITPIEEFNAYFKTNFSDKDADTIGGLLLRKFGYVPKRGEKTEIDSIKFSIYRSDPRRIQFIKVVTNDKSAE